MARTRETVTTVEGPPRNDAYVGMLGLMALAMLVGIGLLAAEAQLTYDWQSEAKGGPTITLPKVSELKASGRTAGKAPDAGVGDPAATPMP